MKKTVSINISGILFNIEEDGYLTLQNYLNNISKYFATYEGSKEIIEDIENRIAEIFYAKIKSGKQIITEEDVNNLITTMGNVKDFEEVEEQETTTTSSFQNESKTFASHFSQTTTNSTQKPKRLYKDQVRKLVGGVLAGIGNYIGVDPIWVRLIFVFSFFFFSTDIWGKDILEHINDNLDGGSFAGALFIGYILLWALLPASYELKEETKMRKLYRNPDDAIIGGVSSGIANFFGIETAIVRVIFFLLLIIGGSGFIIYIILWIIMPEAKTLTDKMKMQGEPVTISNIEANLKEKFNVNEGEENKTVKVLVAPLKIAATIFDSLGKAIKPLLLFTGDFVRVVVGIAFILIGIVGFLTLFIMTGLLLGLFDSGNLLFNDIHIIPLSLIVNTLPKLFFFLAFALIFLPFFSFFIEGIQILSQKRIMSNSFRWALFGIWILCVLGIGIMVPQILGGFKEEGVHEEIQEFAIKGKPVVLGLSKDKTLELNEVELKIFGTAGSNFRVVERFRARGENAEDAMNHAKSIEYKVLQSDSALIFDSYFTFKEGSTYRGQELDLELYVPANQEFVITEELGRYIKNSIFTKTVSDFSEDNTYIFADSALKCLTCEGREASSAIHEIYEDGDLLNLPAFTKVSMETSGTVYIMQGQSQKVVIDDQKDQDHAPKVYVRDGSLIIENKSERDWKWWQWWKWHDWSNDFKMYVTVENLEGVFLGGSGAIILDDEINANNIYVVLSGSGKIRTNNKLKCDNLELSISGSGSIDLDVNASIINTDIAGSGHINASGECEENNLFIGGSGKFNGFDLDAKRYKVNISGSGDAEIRAFERIMGSIGGSGSINYKGNPESVDLDESGSGSIVRVD